MRKPYIIGIAGASCSGKSTVAEAVAHRLPGGQSVLIGLDSYYRDISALPVEVIHGYNLDEPAALDTDLMFAQLGTLAEGEAIDKPVYDYKSHTRTGRVERIAPRDYIIIEGLFTLYWPEVRRLLATKVFIDASHDVCLERRIARDRSQRGRTRDEVMKRYREMVGPMYDLHVAPTRRYADTVVNGLQPPDQSASRILDHITRRQAGGP